MNTCNYRLAKSVEAERIADISRSLIEVGLKPTWPARRVLWHMRDRDSIVLTAAADTGLQGFAIMQFGDTTAHLNLLAVLPNRQRRGIGRQLLNWLEDTAVTAGTFIIDLELRASNSAARDFYTACEYRQIGFVHGYYQGLDSAIKMSRDLRTHCANDERQR